MFKNIRTTGVGNVDFGGRTDMGSAFMLERTRKHDL